jgi:hypothetical protein
MAAWTDYAENKIIDAVFRAQALGAPASLYIALVTANGTDSTAGTEVTGGSYARQLITASLANMAGTQSAGSTTASSGTNGTTSNNNVITFPAPTANWGVIVGVEIWDAVSGGNRWAYGALTVSKTVNNGDPAPTFPAATLTFQIDT